MVRFMRYAILPFFVLLAACAAAPPLPRPGPLHPAVALGREDLRGKHVLLDVGLYGHWTHYGLYPAMDELVAEHEDLETLTVLRQRGQYRPYPNRAYVVAPDYQDRFGEAWLVLVTADGRVVRDLGYDAAGLRRAVEQAIR